MGLLNIEVTFPASSVEAARHTVIIDQFRITEFGHQLFGVLAALIEEELLSDTEDENEMDEDLKEQ